MLKSIEEMAQKGYPLLSEEGVPFIPYCDEKGRVREMSIAGNTYVPCEVRKGSFWCGELIGKDGASFKIEGEKASPEDFSEPVQVFEKRYCVMRKYGAEEKYFVDLDTGIPLTINGKTVRGYHGSVEFEGTEYASLYLENEGGQMLDRNGNPLPLFNGKGMIASQETSSDGTKFTNVFVSDNTHEDDFALDLTQYVLKNGRRFFDEFGRPIDHVNADILSDQFEFYMVRPDISATHAVTVRDKDGKNVRGSVNSE
jgi:hypothetical protein